MAPIGCIGQGFVGKSHADDFEARGFEVVRYAKEKPHDQNRTKIAKCDVVFVAVPTPTTPDGFDVSIVESVIPLSRIGATVVIQSTIAPGSTELLAQKFADRFIMHAPEFLREKSAAHDAAHPERVIVGIPQETSEYRKRAQEVLTVLPKAPCVCVTSARAAELVKYAGNVFLYMKVVYANILADLAAAENVSYDDVVTMLGADSRIGISHLAVAHASGTSDKPGRGAGGHCFIKDFEAFRRLYAQEMKDTAGNTLLNAFVEKNNQLLCDSGKDLDLLTSVYGPLPQAAKAS